MSQEIARGDSVKKGKLLETLRIAVMCCMLKKEGSMSASELGRFLGCKRNLVIEYVRAHDDLFKISNNGISTKKVFLRSSERENKDSQEFIKEFISFCEDFCSIPSDDVLTKKFIEWFRKNSEPFNQ